VEEADMQTMHTLWLQGEENAPRWIRSNFERLRTLNPELIVKVHCRDDVLAVFEQHSFQIPDNITPQAASDIFRIALLKEGGGIWTDASAFHVRPVLEWLPGSCENLHMNCFAFCQDIYRPISSWFLECKPGSYIVDRWYEAVKEYWNGDMLPASNAMSQKAKNEGPFDIMCLGQTQSAQSYPYFWFHHLFAYLLQTDSQFKQCAAQCRFLSSEAAHLVQWQQQRFGRKVKLSKKFVTALDAIINGQTERHSLVAAMSHAPVQKLNWRVEYDFDQLVLAAARSVVPSEYSEQAICVS
jgi:hypothetical protein